MIDEAETARLTPAVGERDHIQGPEDAPVTLVEYGDYECPYCGEAYPIVKELQSRPGNQMRFVFRNFPLSEAHPHAERAAEAAEAAAVQGKFWEMHDYLFEHQDALEDSDLVQYAEALGLDRSKFEHDIGSKAVKDRVHADFRGGLRSGVNGTPTFYINGMRHNGSFDLDSLLTAIESVPSDR